MTTTFHFLNFAINFAIIILIFIYYVSNKNRHIFDFLIINIISFISFSFLLIGEHFNKVNRESIFHKINVNLDITSTLLFMFFIYEVITNKKFKKKFYYIILILVIMAITISINFFVQNLDVDVFRTISKFLFTLTALETVFILLFNVKKISSEMKTQVIKFLIFLFLTEIISSSLKIFFNIPNPISSHLTLNTLIMIYFFSKTIQEINDLKKKNELNCPNHISGNLENKFKEHNITHREKEIILLILEKKTNKEIADELFISINTVKIHVYNIYKKFDTNKRADFIKLINN